MRRLAFVFLFITLICCKTREDGTIIMDVRSIVNKSPNETESILGKPDSTYTIRILGKPILCHLYEKHHIEIQFHENLATDIVVYGPHNLSFNQTALRAFNIDYKTHHPDEYVKDRLIRWFDVDELSTISLYNPQFDSAGNISNFNIFFKAKPQEQFPAKGKDIK